MNVNRKTFKSQAGQFMRDTLESMPPTKLTVSSHKQDMQSTEDSPESREDEVDVNGKDSVNNIQSTDDFSERRKDDEVNDDGEDSVNGIPPTDDSRESRKDDEVNDDNEDSVNSIPPTEDSPESRKDDTVDDDCEDSNNGIPLTDDFPESKNNDKVDDDGEDSMCETRPVLPDLVMEKIILISIESNPEMIFSLN